MGVISWIVVGAVVGFVVNRLAPDMLPGGVAGTVFAAVAGAFLGGAIFTLVAGRTENSVDLVSLPMALVGAALLMGIIRKAHQVESAAG